MPEVDERRQRGGWNVRSMRGRRLFILVILVVALVTAVGVWRLQGGTASAQPVPALKVTRRDLIVTVGGVGRIVQAGQPTQMPPAAGSSTAAVGETPGSAVFPLSGQVTEFIAAPGDLVAAGEPLAHVRGSSTHRYPRL